MAGAEYVSLHVPAHVAESETSVMCCPLLKVIIWSKAISFLTTMV